MKIRELLKICKEAPDKECEVYLFNHEEGTHTTNIDFSFDDNCELVLNVMCNNYRRIYN